MAQVEDTRQYLLEMLQDIKGYSLPPGPVLFSPIPFFSGFIAEVVSKTPHVQKSKTIDGILECFRWNDNKIHDIVVGAYGNKETDTAAYTASGLPLELIWIVDPDGVMVNQGTKKQTSYGEQAKHVEKLYPKNS